MNHRGNIDNSSFLGLLYIGEQKRGEQKMSEVICGHRHFYSQLANLSIVHDQSGIIDQDVDVSELSLHKLGELLHRGSPREV